MPAKEVAITINNITKINRGDTRAQARCQRQRWNITPSIRVVSSTPVALRVLDEMRAYISTLGEEGVQTAEVNLFQSETVK